MTRRFSPLLLLMIASLPSHATPRFVEHKMTVKGYSYRY